MHSGKWNINIQFVTLSDFIHKMLKWQTISVNTTPGVNPKTQGKMKTVGR